MGREFAVSFEGELPADLETTWAAVTSGTAGWLWPVVYEPELGGAETRLTGGGKVTVWEPFTHFATRSEGDDGWFNQLDYRLTPNGDGSHLRYTHRGVMGENYDVELDACRKHTDFYYHSLGQYLRYFAGKQASYFSTDAPGTSAKPGAFAFVRGALGLVASMRPDDVIELAIPGIDWDSAIIDYLTPSFIGLRTVDALIRFYGRDTWGWPVGISLHLFAPDADVDAIGNAWTAWLNGLYA
jgi:hypothetical protein